MKNLVGVLSLVAMSTLVESSEKEIPVGSVPKTPPIAVPKAPWKRDYSLDVSHYQQDIVVAQEKERGESLVAKDILRELQKRVHASEVSVDGSSSDEEIECEKFDVERNDIVFPVSHVTSPLEVDKK